MNRIGRSFRSATKRATQYPAVVVDTHGTRASVRLSGNGAILHNLAVIGGNVDVGEAVQVDYTTPEPTIVSVSKTWATEDDLYRLLKKYQIPEPQVPITEFDKVMLFCHRDPSEYQLFAPTWEGISQACSYAYWHDEDEYGEYQGFGHWSIRIPPVEILANSWGSSITFNRPIHIFSEGAEGARLHGYVDMYGAGTVENVHFYWNAQQSKGQYPVENLFLILMGNDDPDFIMNDGDLTVTSGSAYDTRFINCKFTAFGYDLHDPGDPDVGKSSYEYNLYENVVITPPDGSNDVKVIFENCQFYAQSSSNVGWASGVAFAEHSLAASGAGRAKAFFVDCQFHENMDKPFLVNVDTTSEPNVKSITASNLLMPGVTNYLSPERIYDGGLFILDNELDQSPINHVHSSGSSGGYDENAFHLNEAGEY